MHSNINLRSVLFDCYLLIVRLWLARLMINGGQSVLQFFSSEDLRDFFENWFGKELNIPFPLVVAFLTKGTELAGGVLILLGLFTRYAALGIAIVMLAATLIANIDFSNSENVIRTDGYVTITSFLFAVMLLMLGSGRYSLEFIIKKILQRKQKNQ